MVSCHLDNIAAAVRDGIVEAWRLDWLAATGLQHRNNNDEETEMPTVIWDHVHLRSPDPEATAAWLEDVLGGEIIRGPADRRQTRRATSSSRLSPRAMASTRRR
jgi:hypothetical protein